MPDEKVLDCEIHTPDGTVFDDQVDSLILPGEDGQFGILYNHIPYMALLDAGPIVIHQGQQTRKMACGGGFAEIEENEITVLAETAEFPDSLDADQIKERIDEKKERLSSEEVGLDDVEREELEADLKRDQVRLKVLSD